MAAVGRINYTFYNYCRGCELRVPKTEIVCHQCHQPVRKKAHYGRSVGKVYY